MISNLLSNVDGIYIYPVVSLLIFLPVFLLIIYRVIRADKNYISKMENLPLEEKFDENFIEKKS
ncbi:MAG: CcoQ/FixQ family Cbb3-type cytochrome c oxidase assembly chaperone [Ignavibacteriales bacterium CG_4_9_14_3_um_filter_34_10]|nr:MAG: CcoQ/FixQ family Cbb3-type cytochrome c oxidase assembly chaperone [Ignavibacteriales bacterium CG_4_9_14_3_um_filter_34_10]